MLSEYEQLKADIAIIHERLAKYVLRAKISILSWNKFLSTRGHLRNVKVLAFLKDLEQHEWQCVHTAYTQMNATDEMWDMMDIFKDEKFPEHVKLRSNLRKLRDRVVEFKKELTLVSIEEY